MGQRLAVSLLLAILHFSPYVRAAGELDNFYERAEIAAHQARHWADEAERVSKQRFGRRINTAKATNALPQDFPYHSGQSETADFYAKEAKVLSDHVREAARVGKAADALMHALGPDQTATALAPIKKEAQKLTELAEFYRRKAEEYSRSAGRETRLLISEPGAFSPAPDSFSVNPLSLPTPAPEVIPRSTASPTPAPTSYSEPAYEVPVYQTAHSNDPHWNSYQSSLTYSPTPYQAAPYVWSPPPVVQSPCHPYSCYGGSTSFSAPNYSPAPYYGGSYLGF